MMGWLLLFFGLEMCVCYADDFMPQGYQFERAPTNGSVPHLRDSAVAFSANGEVAYIFGGVNGDNVQQSAFYSYDFNSSLWWKVNVSHPFSGHCYGQNLLPRFSADNETNNNNNQNIYLWTEASTKNVLIRYNFTTADVIYEDTNNAILLDGACTVAPTNNASIVSFLIFGGSTSANNCSNELWAFYDDGSSTEGQWKLIDIDGKPSQRSDARLAAANSTRIYMFGGVCDNILADAELWLADLEKGSWEKIDVVGENKPPARFGHSLVFDFTSAPPHQLLLFGGRSDNKTHDDVWRFDLNSSQWEPLLHFNSSLPGARSNAGAAFGGGRMILFGGEDQDSQLNNELWQLVLNDDCWSAAFDCESCVVGRLGCGWCNPNPQGFQCVAGAGYGSFLGNLSCANTTATQWSSEYATCPLDQFPGWIIALVIIGCIVLVGTIIYFVMRRNSKVAGYENIG